MEDTLFVGIDVGARGGIVGIGEDGEIIHMYAVPMIKNQIDYRGLHLIINNLSTLIYPFVKVVLEDVHSIYGTSAKSNFNFGHIKGVMYGMLIAEGYEINLVKPKVWQRGVWQEGDVVLNEKNKRDPKATSLKAAKRIWPDVDFRKNSRSRIPHDGIIDSALMAEYCRMINIINEK